MKTRKLKCILFGVFGSSIAINSFAAAPVFNPPQQQYTYSVGANPIAAAVMDLGNGHPDIVVANESDNTVGVLLGNGDGTFLAQVAYPVGGSPASVALADLGNGHPDIVVANFNDNTVGVLFGNGDGTFQPMVTYSVGVQPSYVVVANLGNGHPDIVVANANSVGVLIGNGDGTFQPEVEYAVSNGPISSMVVSDLGNGQPDILITTLSSIVIIGDPNRNSYTNSLGWLLGNGDGTLQPEFVYKQISGVVVGAPPSFAYSAAVGDLGNNHADIVFGGCPSVGSSNIGVLLNTGNLNFQPEVTYANGFYACQTPLFLADINNDGELDVLAQTEITLGSFIDILLGNGDGTLQTAQLYGIGGRFAAVADLNGDGYPDLVSLNQNNNTVVVQLQVPPVPPAPPGSGNSGGSSGGGGTLDLFGLLFLAGALLKRRWCH